MGISVYVQINTHESVVCSQIIYCSLIINIFTCVLDIRNVFFLVIIQENRHCQKNLGSVMDNYRSLKPYINVWKDLSCG